MISIKCVFIEPHIHQLQSTVIFTGDRYKYIDIYIYISIYLLLLGIKMAPAP